MGDDGELRIKVLLIGDSRSGKTTLADMFRKGKVSEIPCPTIGADFYKLKIKLPDSFTHKGRSAYLQLLDTAGQERYQSIAGKFYKNADCCVIVYDVHDEKSFKNVANRLSSFKE